MLTPTTRPTWRTSCTTRPRRANSRDAFGDGNKFITPTIVNGHVYVGTPTGVAVFGPERQAQSWPTNVRIVR